MAEPQDGKGASCQLGTLLFDFMEKYSSFVFESFHLL